MFVFSHDEEIKIVEHVETMAQLGYGYTNGKLQEIAGNMANAFGKRQSIKQACPTLFSDDVINFTDTIFDVKHPLPVTS